jgi:PEGA domain-containing protein
MPLPPDRSFVNHSRGSPEDPLGFFLPENEKTGPVLPDPPAPTVHMRNRRRREARKIPLLVRFFGVIVAASRSAMRFTVTTYGSALFFIRGLHVPAWRHGAWRARIASVISRPGPVITRIAARRPLLAVTVSAFVCGIAVGGWIVWLSGASHTAAVESTTSQQMTREVPRPADLWVPPVRTAFANTPVVQIEHSQTAVTVPRVDRPAPITTAVTRRPQFRGSLIVNSRPSGASVFVNGRSVGETPIVLKDQAAGSRAVRVALDGYEPWSAAVQIVADTETQLRAELRAQRPAAQP